jgi:hypothetical protein
LLVLAFLQIQSDRNLVCWIHKNSLWYATLPSPPMRLAMEHPRLRKLFPQRRQNVQEIPDTPEKRESRIRDGIEARFGKWKLYGNEISTFIVDEDLFGQLLL